ncbi:hypothetical protein GG344DRAFT_82886 [Lentinula edodes]|nr:hypothetical protein GG344DRAFT_82886 [Lentinula edodes]
MSSAPARHASRTPSPPLPTLTALGELPSLDPESDGEVETDQLAFTIESLSRPQLQLFETVFSTGKLLSAYCQDNPLWLLLAEVTSPCTNCVKTPGKCRVLPNSPRYLAYSQSFLELHGTPTHQSTWGIPLTAWREYGAALHARTSSTSTLLELNMLDEQDMVDADQRELQEFLILQQNKAAVAAKRKRDRSPMPVAGPSSEKIWSDAPKQRSHRKSPVVEVNSEPSRRVRLVVTPVQLLVSTSLPVPPPASSSLMGVPNRDLPMQGSSNLVRLATVAELHSGLVQQAISSPSIKGAASNPRPPNMPPTPCSTLVPRALTAHPYHAENQCLLAWVQSLESQLADSQRENSSLTMALRDTSHALEARQWEVEQLRTSRQEVLQHEIEYCAVLDQFRALDRSLPGLPSQTILQCFQAIVEELHVAKKDRAAAVGELSTASRRSSELTTALLQQQGLVDETNALATRQRRHLEELQEEVHCTRDCAVFVEQMIKEYPEEGFYEVVLPPLSELEGDLKKVNEDLRRIATFAHHLYHSDPATVLHHHSHYIGAIIESVIAFLRRGLDSDDPNVVAHNFQLALDYMQTARGIHGDLYMQSVISIRWFFNNTVDEDEGLHCLVLEHSRFDNDGPFLTSAQHALEQLMLDYIHHITDTPLSIPVPSVESLPIADEGVPSSPVPSPSRVPLFLPEQESPTSPSPVLPSPRLPPLFGSVANLTIDLTGDEDNLYEPEDSRRTRDSEANELKEEPL